MYILSFFKKGDTIQGGTLFEEIGYPKKVLYGAKLISFSKLKTPSEITTPLLEWSHSWTAACSLSFKRLSKSRDTYKSTCKYFSRFRGIPLDHMINSLILFYSTHIEAGGGIKKKMFFFWQMRIRKFASEIYWPLIFI